MNFAEYKRTFSTRSSCVLSALFASVCLVPTATAATGGLDGTETPPPAPTAAPAADLQPTATAGSGGVVPGAPVGSPLKFKIIDGLASPQTALPAQLQGIVARGNAFALNGYRYGDGHKDLTIDTSVRPDCSGSVSLALGQEFLARPLASYDFPKSKQFEPGPGQYVTLLTKPSHIYMVVGNPKGGKGAAISFDTSNRRDRASFSRGGKGSRWSLKMRSTAGYTVLHPKGL